MPVIVTRSVTVDAAKYRAVLGEGDDATSAVTAQNGHPEFCRRVGQSARKICDKRTVKE